MQTQPEMNFDGMVKKQKKRKRWQQIVSTLVCIVVFCTTYALILPAITISGQITCGMEEHIHGPECYERIGHTGLNCITVHSHSDGCYNADGELVCGISDRIIHVHNEYCLDENGILVCKLEEFTGHLHSSVCYTAALSENGTGSGTAALTCGKEGLLIHTHTAECLDESGRLTCGLLETVAHVHSASCLRTTYTQGSLNCQLTEHTHTQKCYEEFPEELRGAFLLMSSDSSDTEHSATIHQSIYQIPEDAIEISHTIPSAEYDPETGLYDVSLQIDWTLDASTLQQYDKFHILMPENVIIPDDLLDKWYSFTDDTLGVVAFDARFEVIEGKYYVHIEYRADYLNTVTGEVDNHIKFEGQLESDAVQDDGSIKLEWTNGTTTTINPGDITYPPDETLHYDINTQKTASYNSATGELTYVVKVSSQDGTPSPIQINDVLSTNGITLSQLKSITVVDQDGQAVSATTNHNLSAGTLDISISQGLEAGEYYLITYVYKIAEVAPGTVVYPNNKVSATATDTTTKESVTSSSNASVKVDKEMVSKTGYYDPATKLITWTIVVNPDGDNIAGYVLTDDMMKLAQSLTIKGSSVSGTVDNSAGATVDYDTGTITFTPGSGGENRNTYTITYTTYHDQTTANTPVNNTVVLKNDHGEQIKTNQGTAGVTVPGDGGISKDGTLNPGSNTINWSVSVDVPSGGIGAGTVITDKLGPSWGIDKNHWMTQKQIYDLAQALAAKFPGVDYTLEFSTDSWNWIEYSKAIQDTNTTEYYAWRLTFHENVPGTGDFTIDYSTSVDLSKVTSEVTYQNSVQMGNYSGWDSITYKPTAAKLDRYYRSGITDISSSDGIIGWYIRIAPLAGRDQIVVTDHLPAGLTIRKLGIGPDGSSASSGSGYGTGTLTTWTDYQAAYTISGQDITVTITPTNGKTTLPDTYDIYVYVDCQIDDMPGAGETKHYEFKNEATVDGYPVDQTQNVTVTIPERVVKTDGNGNASDTQTNYNAENRTLGWYVNIYFDKDVSDTITITDILPDNLTLTKVGLSTNSWSAKNSFTSVHPSVTSGTVDEGRGSFSVSGNTLTVTSDQDYTAGTYLYLYVEGTFDALTNETQDNKSVSFKNQVSVKAGSTVLGNDQQTQTVVVPPPAQTPKVDKNALWNGQINQLQYQVLINPKGEDLDNTAATIKVEDVLSYRYDPWWNTVDTALINGSVKLYKAAVDSSGNPLVDSNGNYLLGDPVTEGWSWTYSDNFPDVQWGGTLRKTITATVPDETPLIFTYIYEVSARNYGENNGATQAWIDITNAVTVTGSEAYSDNTGTKDTWEASGVSGGATSSGTYTLHKVQDGNYNVVLPGAEFTIYTYADDTPLMDGSGNIVKLTSGDNGAVKVTWSLGYFEKDVVYYIVETKAPAGYDLPAEPTKYCFYYKSTDDADASFYIPDGAVNLSAGYGIAYVENTPEEVNVISVDKVWLDTNGNPIANPPKDHISFHLIQKDYKGNEEHFFHNTLKDGIQVYAHHSVIWTATETGTVELTYDTEASVEVHDLVSGELVTVTNHTFQVTAGTHYQIMLEDDEISEMSWTITNEDGVCDAGSMEIEHGSWSTTIMVPKHDEEGHDYHYSAREVEIDGFVSEITTTADGDIVITNRAEDTTSITVEKAWRVNSMIKKPVQIQLYQTVDRYYSEYIAYLGFINYDGSLIMTPESPVTFTTTESIKGAGEYSVRWDMSLYGFKDSVGAQTLYIDIVDPHFALKGYTISGYTIRTDHGEIALEESPQISQHGGGYTRITFHNIWDSFYNFADEMEHETGFRISADGYLEVTFELAAPVGDANGGVLDPLSAYIPSANIDGIAIGEPITLNNDVNWMHVWNGLPKTGTDSNGNLVQYSYYVEELGDEYDVRYTYQYGVRDKTIVVSNYPKSTADLTVNKQWLDVLGNSVSAPVDNVEYELWQERLCTVMIYSGGWGYDNNSVQYLYIPYGSKVKVTFIGHDIQNSGEFESVSYGTTYGYYDWSLIREVTVVREVNDHLAISICCNLGGYNDANGQGQPLFNGTYTLSNGTKVTLGIVSISWEPPADYEPEFEYVGNFELNALNDWTYLHDNVIPGVYKLKEVTTGYTVTYYVDGTETDADSEGWIYPSLEAGDSKTVTMQNETASTSLTVNKLWRDNGENSDVSRIAITLHQVDKNGNDVAFASGYLQNDGSGNWTLTFDGLPTSDGDGNAYTYYVAESSLEGYYTTYSANGGDDTATAKDAALTANGGSNLGTITITNRAVTSVGVNKQWAEGVSQTAVKLVLWRVSSNSGFVELEIPFDENGNVDLVELEKIADCLEGSGKYAYICCDGDCTHEAGKCTASKSKTFKNLPMYEFDSDGNVTTYYTYFVLEEASGYIKTYSADSFMTGGSYTITNDVYKNSISVDKNWSDGTTDSVDVQIWQELIAHTSHSYNGGVVTEPTCSSAGYTTYTCSVCGFFYNTNFDASGGHTYGDWTTVTEPTCSTTGIESRTCSGCGAVESRSVSATGAHDYLNGVCTQCGAADPTYDGSGLDCPGWWEAHTDGLELTEDLLTITFHSVTYDSATEIWDGPLWILYRADDNKVGSEHYFEYWVQRIDDYGWNASANRYEGNEKLTDAGISYSSSSAAIDPANFLAALKTGIDVTITAQLVDGEAVVTMASAEVGINITVRSKVIESTPVYLSLSGDQCKLTEITSEYSHNYESVVTKPTCTAQGYTTYTCSYCGDSYTADFVGALGHVWDSGTVTKEPTSTETGIKTYVCTHDGCDETKEEILPATGSGSDSKEKTIWTDGLDCQYGWNNTAINIPGDISITDGGYFTVHYTTYANADNGVEFYLNNWTNKHRIDYQAVNSEHTFEIAYTSDMPAVEYIIIGGWGVRITKVTWTPGSAVQSLSNVDTQYATVYLDGGAGGSERVLYDTQRIDPNTPYNWDDLPKFKLDHNGNIVGYYVYYVVEDNGAYFNAQYTYTDPSAGQTVTQDSMTSGITSGSVVITNTQQYHYELPATGGSGTQLYTLGGIAVLIGAAFVLMYNHKKGRKGVAIP